MRPQSIEDYFGDRTPICKRCFEALDPAMKPLKLGPYRGFRLYPYNEFLRSAIYAFKGCRDYALKDAFITYQKTYIRMLFRSYALIPAASAKEHDERRGFNHVQEIFGTLGLPMLNVLEKTETRKQSDLTVDERKRIKEFIRLPNPNLIEGKKILFVDDVMTTGSTALASMDLLREAGAAKIRFLVLGRVEKKRGQTDKNA